MLAPLRLKITRHKKDFKKVLRPWIVNNTVLEPTFKHYSQIWRHVIDAKDVQCFILKVFTDAGRPFVWLRTAVPEVVVLSIPSSSLILCPHMKQAWFPWQRYPYHSCTTSAEGDHYHALVQCSSLRSDTGNKKNQKTWTVSVQLLGSSLHETTQTALWLARIHQCCHRISWSPRSPLLTEQRVV